MGHFFVQSEGQLSSNLKQTIIDGIENDEPPRWLHVKRDRTYKPLPECWDEQKQKILKWAREDGEERRNERGYPDAVGSASLICHVQDEPDEPPFDDPFRTTSPTGILGTDAYAPDEIIELSDISVVEAARRLGYHSVGERNRQVHIELTENGTVEQVKVGRDFHH